MDLGITLEKSLKITSYGIWLWKRIHHIYVPREHNNHRSRVKTQRINRGEVSNYG